MVNRCDRNIGSRIDYEIYVLNLIFLEYGSGNFLLNE